MSIPQIEDRHLAKFRDPDLTVEGEPRAFVPLQRLETLWFNTGTLCNLECAHCYIESSPRNDRLVYLTPDDLKVYLDEIERGGWQTREIGFTGGEPFMNPHLIDMLEECLHRGFEVLVLTNGMRPMMKQAASLISLRYRYGKQLTFRVSLDHYQSEVHERERGVRSWEPTVAGLRWLAANGFPFAVAGRRLTGETEEELRTGYGRLFAELGLALDAADPGHLVIFPEMDLTIEVPEITTHCWNILEISPVNMMCASSRMVVKRRGADRPVVLSCTLLPYDEGFEMGSTLAEAAGNVKLNHPHCAMFCVLGGGSCSSREGR
ncbi:MAG: radical SAM protein [Candidatus Latescibacteria bacterium]|nr:radical SAM protein [Candidatus Latescibacterota bacterium]